MSEWFRCRRFEDGSSMWRSYDRIMKKWTYRREILKPEAGLGWGTQYLALLDYCFNIREVERKEGRIK